MYLFTRRVRARTGGINDAMAWATGITEKACQITGLDIALSMSVFGPQVGTLVWSTAVPDLATLEAAFDKMNVDAAFNDEASRGQQFAPDGPDDRLLRFVFPDAATLAAGAQADQPPWQYATVVTSVLGQEPRRGMEAGVQLAVKASELTGVPVGFLADTTGQYGGVNWISTHADIQSVEAANDALSTNEEWLALLESTVGAFAEDPALTTQLVYRRIL